MFMGNLKNWRAFESAYLLTVMVKNKFYVGFFRNPIGCFFLPGTHRLDVGLCEDKSASKNAGSSWFVTMFRYVSVKITISLEYPIVKHTLVTHSRKVR